MKQLLKLLFSPAPVVTAKARPCICHFENLTLGAVPKFQSCCGWVVWRTGDIVNARVGTLADKNKT